MTPYITTFAILLFFYGLNNAFKFSKNVVLIAIVLLYVYFVIFVGLRYEIGGDWGTYLKHFEYLGNFNIEELFSWNPGYQSLQFISKFFGFGIYGVNVLCTIIFLYGFNKFIKVFNLNMPLSYLIAFPYIIMVVVSGYSRQGVAIGLVFGFIASLYAGKYLFSFIYLFLATSFHETAIIGAFLYSYVVRENKKIFFILILLFLILLCQGERTMRFS